MSLLHNVQQLLSDHGYTPEADPMLCGLSGGADSIALVHVLQQLHYEVIALHCNFQLRGEESERDEQFVRSFCAGHGIRLRVIRFDTRAEAALHGESIEMAARRLRYDWFQDEKSRIDRENSHPSAICVAHHADDNVETMLLNLIRGAGLHGLTGMRFQNERGILRPLLTTTRAEILDYLACNDQPFVNDSSNADAHYRRNKVRHELLPLLRTINPSIDRTLTETMAHLMEAETMLKSCDETGVFALRQQLLAQGFKMDQIVQMEKARNGAYVVQGGNILTKHNGQLIAAPLPEPLLPTPLIAEAVTAVGNLRMEVRSQSRSAVSTLRDKSLAVFDQRAVKGGLIVRSVQDGDRFQPFGMKGKKLVSDYLTDRKRSRIDKMRALVVCDEVGILWLVGETIAQRAAVVTDTYEVLTLRIQ